MITLLVNPAAGNGRAKKVAKTVEELLNQKKIPYLRRDTDAPNAATQLAQEAASAAAEGDFLLTVGGDGTFLESIQGLAGSRLPVAAIPAGTGNDFLKSLKMPADPAQALEHVLNAPLRQLDVGTVNGALFANECGAGFDVAVLDYAEPVKKHFRGLIPYLWGVIKAVFCFHSLPLTVTADGKEVFRGDSLVFSVANGQFIGGGIRISPEADVQSGLLELIVLQKCGMLRKISYLPGLLGGKILRFRDTVVHCRASHVTVSSTRALRVNVDGEIHPMAQCEFTVLPGHLTVKM